MEEKRETIARAWALHSVLRHLLDDINGVTMELHLCQSETGDKDAIQLRDGLRKMLAGRQEWHEALKAITDREDA